MKTGIVQFVRSRQFVVLAAVVMSQSATAANINDAFLAMEVPNGSEAVSFPGPNGGTITLGYNFTPTNPDSFVSTGLVHSNAYNGWSSIEGFAAPSLLPALHVNTLGAPNVVPGFFTVGKDQIYMHAGNPAGDPVIAPFAAAVLRYTVPITGIYDITGSFDSIDFGIAAVDILWNGTSILEHAGSDATPFSEFGVALNAGDSLDFVVGDSNGNVFSDSTGLYANVVRRSHRIMGDVTSDNQFAIFTSATGVPVTYQNYTGCHPAAVPVDFTTTDRYLYIATWSDDNTAQGLLHDLTVTGLPGLDYVPSDDPRWSVMPMDSDQDSCLTPPFTAIEATMNSGIPGGVWSAPAVLVSCTNRPGCFEVSPGVYIWGHFVTINPLVHRAWYDSGLQGTGGDIPFRPGFNHLEFLVFRLDMEAPPSSPVPIGDVAAPAIAGLLVLTGFLGIAYRQRRQARLH